MDRATCRCHGASSTQCLCSCECQRSSAAGPFDPLRSPEQLIVEYPSDLFQWSNPSELFTTTHSFTDVRKGRLHTGEVNDRCYFLFTRADDYSVFLHFTFTSQRSSAGGKKKANALRSKGSKMPLFSMDRRLFESNDLLSREA